tara:strand:+ start:244 stop:849 length:606 start_codon:yes stop_codon:yes gene_type:complete
MYNYVVDFDTRKPQCKHIDAEVLASYIMDNNLEQAVTLITEPDDIELSLSEKEMMDLNSNLGGKWVILKEGAARVVWDTLRRCDYDIPVYTEALGKKLIKQASQGDAKPTNTKAKSETKTPKKRIKRSSLDGKIFTIGSTIVKPTTAKGMLQVYIEDNFGEATYEELLNYFCEVHMCDEKKARGYISSSVNKDIIKEIEEL